MVVVGGGGGGRGSVIGSVHLWQGHLTNHLKHCSTDNLTFESSYLIINHKNGINSFFLLLLGSFNWTCTQETLLCLGGGWEGLWPKRHTHTKKKPTCGLTASNCPWLLAVSSGGRAAANWLASEVAVTDVWWWLLLLLLELLLLLSRLLKLLAAGIYAYKLSNLQRWYVWHSLPYPTQPPFCFLLSFTAC